MLQEGFLQAWTARQKEALTPLSPEWRESARRPLFVVAEKILSAGESLRKAWAVDGTSGYDFLNLVNHLSVDSGQAPRLKAIYERFSGRVLDTAELVYRCKTLIMSTSMASELNVLAHMLNEISEDEKSASGAILRSRVYATRPA